MRTLRRLAVLATVVAALATVGPASASALPARFATEGDRAGQLSGEPIGLAVSQQSGDVFVADRNNNRVARFGGEGEFKLAWGWGVADGSTNALQTCITTCFAGLEGAGSGQFAFPDAVAVDNDSSSPSFGDVYVVDSRNHRVEKFDSSGAFILMFGREVNATPATTHPDICLAGEQCQAAVEVPEGTVAGNGQFEAPASIAVDAEGTVYVGDTSRVQKFDPEGKYIGQLTLAGAGFTTALAVDSGKNVYLKSSEVPGVREFDEGGTELGTRDATGEPSTITLGAAGELFVNDEIGSHHILEYSPSGTQLASFDANTESGRRGIAYGENLNVIYVLNQGAVRLVTPPPPGPLVLSTSAEAVEPTSATLNATVNPEGPEPTSYHFEYGTSSAYGESTATTPLTGGPFEDQAVPLPAAITGLQTRTTYHFRVVVSNGTQTTDGPDQTFTTLPSVSIDSESATQVGAKGAILSAELDPHGLQSEYHFEYLTDAEFKANGESFTGAAAKPVLAPAPPEEEGNAGSGTSDVPVALQVQGLSPGETYHYRVLAHNSLGIVAGEDRTFTTQREEPYVLPDGRAWEMVSPANKQGVSLEALTEEGGVIQAAEGGGAITYIAKSSIEENPAGNRSIANTQVISERGSGVWRSRDIATPHEAVAVYRAGFPSEYKLFAGDLSSGIVEPAGDTPLSEATTERTPYRRESASGEYVPLVTAGNVLSEAKFGGTESSEEAGAFDGGVEFVTASPDLKHVILASPQALTEGFESNGERSLYELSDGVLSLVSILPGGKAAAEAGHESGVGNNERDMRGAVSDDGSRVVFEVGGGEPHIYLRDLAKSETVELDAPQGGPPGETPRPEFQGASADGKEVFFTDSARLTSDSTAVDPGRPDLYECEVSTGPGPLTCALSDLSVDPKPGESANVAGRVVAVSETGRYVYFAASGALAAGAEPGDCESESQSATCNLYVYDTVARQRRLVAALSGTDGPDWDSHIRFELGNLTARSSPDGRYLTFMSQRSLTGYDNTDVSEEEVVPGEGKKHADEEVYLYDFQGNGGAGSLVCASCNPSGARPQGIFDRDAFPGLLVDRPRSWRSRWLAASIPGWTLYDSKQALYQSRYLSNSGRLFFNSQDALVPQDANGKEDVYQYERVGGVESAEAAPPNDTCTTGSSTYSSRSGGCVSLISSGGSAEESAFMDASADGNDVFFLTAAKLSSADLDSGFDIYDAHVCTSESPCPPPAASVPPTCITADSCRAAPSPQPSIFGLPPSATFNGSANPASPAPVVKAKAKPLTRAQKLARALKACKAKRNKRKQAGCEKAVRKAYGPLKQKGKVKR